MTPPYIAVLDVGHGNCAVIVADERVTVVDAGDKAGTLREFLLEQGITRVDAIVLSHADADHIAGVLRVLSKPEIDVRAVYVNPAPGRTTTAWGDLVTAARRRENAGVSLIAGTVDQNLNARLNGPTVTYEILAPTAADVVDQKMASQPSGTIANTNTLSAVVRVRSHGRAVALLCGDIDRLGFEALKARHAASSSPLLVFPHHGGLARAGGGPNSTAAFVTAICEFASPDVVLFSIGPPFDNPRPEVVASVRAARPDAWIACTQLSSHCGQIQGGADPTHWAPVHARGRSTAACCLGTLLVALSPAGPSFQPVRDAHQKFVALRVTSPLCRHTSAGAPAHEPAAPRGPGPTPRAATPRPRRRSPRRGVK